MNPISNPRVKAPMVHKVRALVARIHPVNQTVPVASASLVVAERPVDFLPDLAWALLLWLLYVTPA